MNCPLPFADNDGITGCQCWCEEKNMVGDLIMNSCVGRLMANREVGADWEMGLSDSGNSPD